jgi:hypothetical protein
MTNTLDMALLAERGAALRLQEIEAERTLILQAFPALNGDPAPAPVPVETPAPAPRSNWRVKPHVRAKRHLTAKQKQDISKRMKSYWRRKREASGS